MRPGLSGVEFDTNVYRPASYIDESIDNVTLAAILGAVSSSCLSAASCSRGGPLWWPS